MLKFLTLSFAIIPMIQILHSAEQVLLSSDSVFELRSSDVRERIDITFDSLKEHSGQWGGSASWVQNGNKTYSIANLDFEQIIENLIFDRNSDEQISIMDIGSGWGAWGNHIAEYIDHSENLRPKKSVNIYNVNGNKFSDRVPQVIQYTKSTVYNIGQIKIEDITKELKNWNLIGKIDLIVSAYCFVHLIDPLGTFIQAYDFLKPNSGIMAIDGFRIILKGQYTTTANDFSVFDQNVLSILKYSERCTGNPILFFKDIASTELYNIVLQRKSEKKLSFPLKYGYIQKVNHRKCPVQYMTEFIPTSEVLCELGQREIIKKLYGNYGLFLDFDKRGFFNGNCFSEITEYGSDCFVS